MCHKGCFEEGKGEVQLGGGQVTDCGRKAQGRQLSGGRFLEEIPFQELKIINNAENLLKSKRLWPFLSGTSTALRESRGLAATIAGPGKAQHPHTLLVFSEHFLFVFIELN